MDYSIIAQYVSEIFNNSLGNFNAKVEDLNINLYLNEYENSVFLNDEETQKLLNNNIV